MSFKNISADVYITIKPRVSFAVNFLSARTTCICHLQRGFEYILDILIKRTIGEIQSCNRINRKSVIVNPIVHHPNYQTYEHMFSLNEIIPHRSRTDTENNCKTILHCCCQRIECRMR